MAKKKTPAAPAPEAPQWMTLAEAAEADRARHEDGVLVELGPRFAEIGIVKMRIVAHDGDEMKKAIGDARKAAVSAYNATSAPSLRIFRWEDLPPEGHRAWECSVAIASLRWGEDLELHGDFAGYGTSTEDLQAMFRAALEDAPGWMVSGLFHAGKALVDPARITDRQILEARKKGSACGLAQALAFPVGAQTGGLGAIGDLLSRLQALASAASAGQSTPPQSRPKRTRKRSEPGT